MTIDLAGTIEEVRGQHHTDKFKTDGFIVRRGYPARFQTASTSFTVTLVPAHPENKVDLGYSFDFSVSNPRKDWSVKSSEVGYATLYVPVTAPIGLYILSDQDDSIPMVVLFNPFLETDPSYCEGERERQEYVLNDVGRIWVGAVASPSGVPWSFSQFRTVVLLTSLSLLDSMPTGQRHDPIKVTRHLSAMVNAQDDNGVLLGRWNGKYGDGTSPSAWTGSLEILEQYWNTLKPVRYGQCWVFAGVLNSVLRALGIASRVITNFVSAHDTTRPYNRSVDKYFDSNGKALEKLSSDSIWNFHVWNEAIMKRPDLQELAEQYRLQFHGWQVLDSTPQEESKGLYRLGPAPLSAIKHGQKVPLDVDFVIGEVNADVIYYWKEEGSKDFQVRLHDKRYVGQNISTKDIGSDSRKDVTQDYKFREGTPEERAALAGTHVATRDVRTVLERQPVAQPIPEPPQVVSFAVQSPPHVTVGEPIKFVIKGSSKAEGPVTIIFNCLYRATDYTGTPRARIGDRQTRVTVGPGLSADMAIEVTAAQYEPHLGGGVQTIQFISSAKVRETGQVWSSENLVRLNADETLHLRAPSSVTVDETLPVTAVIRNISHMPLTNAILRAEGEGIVDMTITELETIAPGATVEKEITIEPSEAGDKLLVTTLVSTELKDVSRSVHIRVNSKFGRERHGQPAWHGKQSKSMASLVQIQGRKAASARKKGCLPCC